MRKATLVAAICCASSLVGMQTSDAADMQLKYRGYRSHGHHSMHGTASYYGGGEKLNRHTANGDVFNPHALTAAHRSLPLGSRVRVTNARTGKSVVVRINDRGPASWTGRAIDLSKGAFRQIANLASGLVQVVIAPL
jgi:rare lipoprotein A